MIIGIDFDNTITNYDSAIEKLSLAIKDFPKDRKRNKQEVKLHLIKTQSEEAWTKFQGELYGPGMIYAKPQPGSIEIMRKLQLMEHKLIIISHRSKSPYLGPAYDLHKFAKDWIEKNLKNAGLFNEKQNSESSSNIHFLETKSEKARKIATEKCEVFIDDLEEIFRLPEFPKRIKKILFNSSVIKNTSNDMLKACTWEEIYALLN